MTRLDRILKLLEEYDDLVIVALSKPCPDKQWCKAMLAYVRDKKKKLTQELIEHGCRRKN